MSYQLVYRNYFSKNLNSTFKINLISIIQPTFRNCDKFSNRSIVKELINSLRLHHVNRELVGTEYSYPDGWKVPPLNIVQSTQPAQQEGVSYPQQQGSRDQGRGWQGFIYLLSCEKIDYLILRNGSRRIITPFTGTKRKKN